MKNKLFAALTAITLLVGLTACGGSKTVSSTAETSSTTENSTSAASSSTAASAATADTADLDYIINNGEMVIGITYFEPMNYLDADGNLTGFETEFATAVCEKLGVTPKFQEINWSAKETELSAKNIDCIWNGMTITEDRKANMSISRPYMKNMQVLVVKSENAKAFSESVEGLTIAAEAGSAGEEVAQGEEFFAKANYIAVDTQAKALMETASGTVDGCVIDYVTSIGMIGEGTDYANLVALEERGFGEEEYGIAFRKQDTNLTAKVDEIITEMISSGKLKEIAEKYKLGDLLITE